MLKYKVTYERRTSPKLSFWKFSTEIIEVRGIVHAHKLARDHLRDLKKLTSFDLRIYRIMLVEDNNDAD